MATAGLWDHQAGIFPFLWRGSPQPGCIAQETESQTGALWDAQNQAPEPMAPDTTQVSPSIDFKWTEKPEAYSPDLPLLGQKN
jgi:hypothetical protein